MKFRKRIIRRFVIYQCLGGVCKSLTRTKILQCFTEAGWVDWEWVDD